MAKTFYVTTPIYYVNDAPHIGHSYTTIAADVLARFFRAAGRDVHFLTGTDEHGIKIYKTAQAKNIAPGALADDVVGHFLSLWDDLEITHDDFIRTTQPRHEQRVQAIVQALIDADEIYLGHYEGWYDEGQEEFVPEATARANEYKGEISARPLVRYVEPSYFFRLTKWVPRLIEYIEANPQFVQPDARRNEVLSKLRMGVEDLSISRSAAKLPWGVPMPNDPTHVVYVWIDALSNYITALGYPPVGRDDDNRYWSYWPADLQLIGKDILWFHAVYWPCMLMALGLPLPRTVFAHGWWTSEGKKMSKTLGNFISREVIADLCQEYSVDVYRWFLLRAVTFGTDGDFSREHFQVRYNSELANGIGNLLSRTVNMIGRYFSNAVPAPGPDDARAAEVRSTAEALCSSAVSSMESCAFTQYLERINELAAATNRYIDTTEPFKVAKDDSRRDELATILWTCAEAVRVILVYLAPMMPSTASRGLAQLGLAGDGQPLQASGQWGVLKAGSTVAKGDALFPRKL